MVDISDFSILHSINKIQEKQVDKLIIMGNINKKEED